MIKIIDLTRQTYKKKYKLSYENNFSNKIQIRIFVTTYFFF
jgi:hypothetical protein